MTKFDVIAIAGDYYLVVQAEHLLSINSIIVVPVLPQDVLPELSKLTVDVTILGDSYRIRAHMPVTVDAARLQGARTICQLSAEDGQRVMDGLYAILWGL